MLYDTHVTTDVGKPPLVATNKGHMKFTLIIVYIKHNEIYI